VTKIKEMPPRGKCNKCDLDIGAKENFFKCAACDYQCHAKCDSRYFDVKERIADVTYQHFELMGFRWFCQKCTPNLSSIEENVIVKEIKTLCERIGKIEKHLLPSEKESLTYATVAKGLPERALVIKNTNGKMSGKKMAKIVQSSFDPVFAKVSNLRVYEEKCVIKAKLDDENLQEFAKRIKNRLGKGCEAEPVKSRNPRVKIIGNIRIEENELDNEQLLSYIKKQNTFIPDDVEIKVVKKADAKTNLPDHIIIETTPRAYRTILKTGYLTVGYARCKVYDANSVPRCFKCSRLGHFEKNCSSESSIRCPKCAGSHKLKECYSDLLCCVNCEDANQKLKTKIDVHHAAFDRNCPQLARRNKILRSFFENENG
jgi:hypothetical protein